MISRLYRPFVAYTCCAILAICFVDLHSVQNQAMAKSYDVVTGVHQEGMMTLTFHAGILEELGWDVPSGVEQALANEPSQTAFSIVPGSDLSLTSESLLSDSPQGLIETRGAFLVSTSNKFYQISGIAIEARNDGFWYVTATIPGKGLHRVEFDFLLDTISEDAATQQATIIGELCLAQSSASALGASRYQGTCIASIVADLEYIDNGESVRYLEKSNSHTKNIYAKASGLCTIDSECPAGQVCDISDGSCKNGPDLIVAEIQSTARFGRDAAQGITAFSIGTTSCNIGDMPANWFSQLDGPVDEQKHPVIAQNFHRFNEELRDGNGVIQRPSSLEQIGMSWVKHAFQAGTENDCNPPGVFCDLSAGDNFLGPNCSDAYNATQLNGFQRNLGPRYEVNPTTGIFTCWDQFDAITGECTPAPDLCFPCSSLVDTLDIIKRRIQLHDDDLSPAQNPNSHYIAEAHYVAADDANAQNDNNNNAYREFFLSESIPLLFTFSSIGAPATQRMKSAIDAWKDYDPTVIIQTVDVINDGRFLVAAKATDMGDGTWHYEYAIQNLNSDRCGQSFSIPVPMDATILSTGLHDIDSHSNSPYSSVDWTPLEAGGAITWSTDTQAVDPFANALRWGTIYNFRFVTDVCPTTGDATLGLFKPLSPDPDSIIVTTIVPGDCATCEAAITLDTSEPVSGFVDVLQPSEPNGSSATGIRAIDYTFNAFPNCTTPIAGDYQVSQLGGTGIAPSIDSAQTQAGGEIRVTLSAPVNPGARTTITHMLSGIGAEVGFLPGDVNRDGTTNRLDLTAIAMSMDSLSLPLSDSDMDRNGSTNTSDILRLIDLLQGAGMYDIWDGSSLP